MRMVRVTTLLVALGLAAALSVPVSAQSNVLLIVDASGSMKKPVGGGESRMDAAKRVLGETLHALPAETRLGLMVYGHRRAKDCTDIELMSPLGADDAGTIAARIQALQPKGETPIAGALQQAARSFAALKGQANTIVLVTDGIEECHGNPCAAAKAVRVAGLDLKIDIVGFTLNPQERQAIECVAKETGGVYYDAKDAKALSAALVQVRQQVAQVQPPAGPPQPPAQPKAINLLGAEAGGQVLVAPNDAWLQTIDGKLDGISCREATPFFPGAEAVYAFKDEQAATFDTFSTLIPGTSAWNLKDFELLVADDSPTGSFRSIGKFQAQNVKLLKTQGWQEFKFPPVTAKYLKVQLLSNYGYSWPGNAAPMCLYEFRLLGTLQQ